jgi:hypothetical protein
LIYLEDQNGNLVTSDNTTQVTASLRSGTGPLLGTTTVTVSEGVATFTNLGDDKAETITLLFTVSTLGKAQANPVTIDPAAARKLSITAPASTTAGKAFTITVTALDPYNNVATGYRGTVRFTSSDKLASLPGNFIFTAGNGGVHTFGNGVTLRTSGTHTITAADLHSPSVTGSASVSVGVSASLSVLADGAASGLADSHVREALTPKARQPKAATALRTSSHPARATTGGARTTRQADAARDRVFSELKGNLHAHVMAERLADGRLD